MEYKEYRAYLQSPEWKEKAKAAKREAGGRCQLCNSRGPLHAHHRTYARLGNERPGDLTALCEYCHEAFHTNNPTFSKRNSNGGSGANTGVSVSCYEDRVTEELREAAVVLQDEPNAWHVHHHKGVIKVLCSSHRLPIGRKAFEAVCADLSCKPSFVDYHYAEKPADPRRFRTYPWIDRSSVPLSQVPGRTTPGKARN